MKPKKLTAIDFSNNRELWDEAYSKWLKDFREGGRRSFDPPVSRRFTFDPKETTFRVKSGNEYRPMHLPVIDKDGRELVIAVQRRNGLPYGAIRMIDVNNTDLVE